MVKGSYNSRCGVIHGMRYHKLYKRWQTINAKCYYDSHHGYHNYGGRGITMSDEFKDNPKAFIEYIESLPNYENMERDNLTLDRIENDGNYERGNLRWATKKEQVDNRRPRSKNSPKINFNYGNE